MLIKSNTLLHSATKRGFSRVLNLFLKIYKFAKKLLTNLWTKRRNVSPVSISHLHLIYLIFFQTVAHHKKS